MEPDVPEELEGRLRWAQRDFNFHRDKANSIKLSIERQEESGTIGGVIPNWLLKQMKEEGQHARAFEDAIARIESKTNERLKPYFLIKDNLFAAALFFYVYTDAKQDPDTAV